MRFSSTYIKYFDHLHLLFCPSLPTDYLLFLNKVPLYFQVLFDITHNQFNIIRAACKVMGERVIYKTIGNLPKATPLKKMSLSLTDINWLAIGPWGRVELWEPILLPWQTTDGLNLCRFCAGNQRGYELMCKDHVLPRRWHSTALNSFCLPCLSCLLSLMSMSSLLLSVFSSTFLEPHITLSLAKYATYTHVPSPLKCCWVEKRTKSCAW